VSTMDTFPKFSLVDNHMMCIRCEFDVCVMVHH